MGVRSLFAGVSGLRNFQMQLDIIGNNIANSQTMGYKSSRVTFADMLSQTSRGASAPTATIGGTNPMQYGLGSTIGAIDTNFSQGILTTTGRQLDLAITGNGLFGVRDGNTSTVYYTRNGAFDIDQLGHLVSTSSGFIVQGYDADAAGNLAAIATDIQIPIGVTLPAEATTSASAVGNLDSSAQQIGSISNSSTLLSAGLPADSTSVLTALTNAAGISLGLAGGDTITISGTYNGTTFTGTQAVGANTLGTLCTTIATTLGLPAGNVSVVGGQIQITGLGGTNYQVSNLSLTSAPAVFNTALGVGTWSTTQNAQDNHAASFIAYDENGASHTVTLKYNIRPPVGTLAHWVVAVESTDTATGNADTSATWSSLLNTADLYFNGDGSLNSASDSTIIIDPYNATVGNITFPLNWGTLGGYDGIVQFEGDSSARAIDVTGYAAGELQNITVNDTGL
ncbi:MAG: flagellar hook-basal body complex protein, partial [Candidatus Aureabacteria bacterium]|nr:flagellar hook-basal body complex protein [Candidatus Auribacterota bacterium]